MRGALAGALIGVVAGISGALLVECAPTAPAEQITVVQGSALWDYVSKLEHCRAVGREAGSYAVYSQCEQEAGLR